MSSSPVLIISRIHYNSALQQDVDVPSYERCLISGDAYDAINDDGEHDDPISLQLNAKEMFQCFILGILIEPFSFGV